MNDLRHYIKYYSLENYLFGEVHYFFDKEKYLTAEQFIAIIIWKRNASKTLIIRGLEEKKMNVCQITSDVANATTPLEKIQKLIEVNGIGVSIASAILTVCYPLDFTVADYRAISSLYRLKWNPYEKEILKTYEEYERFCKRYKKLSERFEQRIKEAPTDKRKNDIKNSLQLAITNLLSKKEHYLDYVKICQAISKEKGLTLRELDKALWGMDFYNGEGGLEHITKSLKCDRSECLDNMST